MIDFRYHIVSLISVFLALAVGIVLGAGPLRDYIADSLTGQVDQLREETEELREELEASNTDLRKVEDFLEVASPELITDVLPDYTVSLVLLPGVESETATELSETLRTAGASVLNIVQVTPDFTDPAKRPFRSGIASSLTAYMDPEPSEDSSAEVIIGAGLNQALQDYDSEDPQAPSEDSLGVIDLLKSSELVTADGDLLPTQLTVVLAGDEIADEEVLAAELGFVKGMDSETTLVAGQDAETSLVRAVRTDSDAGKRYTTTDSVYSAPGQSIIPRALAVLVEGDSGAYGFGERVDSVLPPQVKISKATPVEPESNDEDSDPNASGLAEFTPDRAVA